MTWDGVVTKYHLKYIRELEIKPFLEAYIQSLVLKKTIESISMDRRRGFDQRANGMEEMERAVNALVNMAQVEKEEDPAHSLANNEIEQLELQEITTESMVCEGHTMPKETPISLDES